MNVTPISFGGLEAVALGEATHGTIVMLHGYGANMHDLVPIAGAMSGLQGVRWIFPQAPLAMPSPLAGGSRAWFPIDETRLQEAMMTGRPRDLSGTRPDGMDDALTLLEEAIPHHVNLNRPWAVAGFSQGSMLALELCFRVDPAPNAVLIFSGSLVDEAGLDAKLPSLNAKSASLFQSHGRHDPVLGFDYAERLRDKLAGAFRKEYFHPFDGGHTIPMEVVDASAEFLRDVFRQTD